MAPWGHKYGGPLRTLAGMARCEGLGALYAGRVQARVQDKAEAMVQTAARHKLGFRSYEYTRRIHCISM